MNFDRFHSAPSLFSCYQWTIYVILINKKRKIPCSNAFVESIFGNMNHLWSDYRNRMDIELLEAELQIRKNSSIPCANFYNFLLTQGELLQKITSNEKFVRKKRF